MRWGEGMKIIHLHLSREFAGSETYASDLASRQAEAGHSVALVVRQSEVLSRWQQRCGKAALLVVPRWAVGPLAVWVVQHYVRGFEPNLLHSHLGRAHKLAQKVAAKLKLPHVGTMHLRYKPAEHERLDARIAIAGWQVDEVPEALRASTYVVRNPVPIMPVAKRKARGGVFVFGSVGRLHPHKGMAELVQAFRLAFPHETVGLEIIGEGPERDAIEQVRQGDERIVLHGNVSAAGFYGGWDCYISAARYEPFGLTLLEAMQQNLPIVATQTQGATEIFGTQSTNPLWAKLNDVESLATALTEAFQSKKKEVVWDLSPFDPAAILAQIEDIYKKVLS